MGASAYIGRVGGLAVGLGIGVAVLYGCGEAVADTGSHSGSSDSSASSSSSAGSSGNTGTHAKSTGAKSEKRSVTTTVSTSTTRTAAAPKAQAAVQPLAKVTGSAPIAPEPDSPAALIPLAAARKQTSGPAFSTRTGNTITLAAAVSSANPPGTAVVQTPPLGWLQDIPVLGPAIVTPIVAAIHQIPIFGDILHPIFGYPIDPTAPAGAPVARDIKLTSFDGTEIYVHFMPATGLTQGDQAPTILLGPGLGMPGSTSLNGTPLDGILTDFLGAVGVGTLRAAGYNVITWDPRGEYSSGGLLELDSPDYEALDTKGIITWAATQPEVALDSPGDPAVGMVGASYGGGIQLVTAAIDPRVDAIVPTIAWNSLNTSLYKGDAFKSGWGTLLTAVLLATFARPNPAIYPAALYGDLTGSLTQGQQDLLAERGPAGLLGAITAPTLLIQGTVDTLFTLQEANQNILGLINSPDTKVIWFCGGHGLCTNNLFDDTDGKFITADTLAWLAKYVKHDPNAVTGAQFEWVDQNGQYYSSSSYPGTAGTPIVASSSTGGVLPLIPFLGGSGPLLFVLPIGGTKALNAYNFTLPAATSTTHIVGAPQLSLTYSGEGISSHVYAQLVDESTGNVLGNQVTPIPIILDGQSHTVSLPLEEVAATLQPGQKVTLQIVASAANYETLWTGGALTVSNVQITLPTVDDAVAEQPVQQAITV